MEPVGGDEIEAVRERGGDELDVFVVLGGGDAVLEVLGEEDLHPLAEEARAGEVAGEAGPAPGADSGFFDHLAPGGGEWALVGLDTAGGELEEELASGVAVLADEDDGGIFGAGAELAIAAVINGEDDDGAVVADDVFLAGDGVAGLDEGVGVDGEDLALVGEFGADELGLAGGAGFGGLLFAGGDWALGGGGGLGGAGVETFGDGGEFGGAGRLLLHGRGHGVTVPSRMAGESASRPGEAASYGLREEERLPARGWALPVPG